MADNDSTLSVEPEEDLPLNPKTWTPSQLSVYLTRALRVRSGERPPERVARDIASWVRREGVTGRTFLRWTDENLRVLGVNMLWRCALLVAARSLRQNILRGRIWGNPPSDPEQEQEEERGQGDTPFSTTLYASSSSSLDLPLTDGDTEAGSERRRARLLGANANGRVRGMVDKWERESVESQSPTRKSDRSCSRSSSESDDGSELGEGEVAAEEDVDVPCALVSVFSDNGDGLVSAADDEPSIEDLLASESAPVAPKDGSWGARAWEELDAGTTVRRLEPHDSGVPRHDDNGSSSADVGNAPIIETLKERGGGANSSSRRVRRTTRENLQLARPRARGSGVQAVVHAEAKLVEEAEATAAVVEAELEAKELALEGEVRDARALLEEFRFRLEEVEARVSAMEAKSHPAEEQQAQVSSQQPQPQAQESTAAEKDTHDNAVEASPKKASVVPECDSPRAVEISTDEGPDVGGPYANSRIVQHVVNLEPTTVSDLPSYVLLVGLGVCAVVLQVVLKRVGGRSLKP
ncbi:hypothetical protein BJV77DRAFT_966894 [Russula vinacea]|nr:hypothetical protein BJV77DRAFT_966894 [Russula vinacea]